MRVRTSVVTSNIAVLFIRNFNDQIKKMLNNLLIYLDQNPIPAVSPTLAWKTLPKLSFSFPVQVNAIIS